MTEIELKCPKCGGQMSPVWFKEKEIAFENGHYYFTGRVRNAVDYLTCPYCLHNECVDEDFMAMPWK